MDKAALRDAALAELERSIERLRASATETRRGATHEESRAENDKDTRGLEASYLARGQAMRVEEVEDEASRLRFLTLRAFEPDEPAGLGAVVRVEIDGEPPASVFFLVPVAGGLRVAHAGLEVQLVTPGSPLGRALIEKRAGDDFELRVGNKVREYELISVE